MNSINSSFKQIDPDLGMIQQSQQTTLNQPQVGAIDEAKGTGFLETLQKTLEETNQAQLEADQSVKDLIAGKSKNIHETMLQLQKADLSLKTMMQVRNKILEAYKEIIKMQV